MMDANKMYKIVFDTAFMRWQIRHKDGTIVRTFRTRTQARNGMRELKHHLQAGKDNPDGGYPSSLDR